MVDSAEGKKDFIDEGEEKTSPFVGVEGDGWMRGQPSGTLLLDACHKLSFRPSYNNNTWFFLRQETLPH